MTLEAVNSVLSNAPYMKAVVEQQSTAKSLAANPARVQEAPTVAPYTSLYIKVDVNFDKALLQFRDTTTGDVLQQIPSESQLEAYRRAQSSNAVRPATIEEEAPVEISTPEVQTAQASPAPQVNVTAPSTPVQTAVVAAPAPQAQSTNIQV